jgi:uncharacterized protein YjiS (DUF1127 family)
MTFVDGRFRTYLRLTGNTRLREPRNRPLQRNAQMAVMTNRTLGAGYRATNVLADIVGRIASWNDARVTRKALSKLSNRELDDLGLNRGDIDDIAAGRL